MPDNPFPYQEGKVSEIRVSYECPVQIEDRVQLRSSKDTESVLRTIWAKNTLEYEERFYVLLLNRSNHILGYVLHTIGGLSGTIGDVKQILAVALKANASAIIISHNHPSSNVLPSQADIQLTKKICQGASYLDLQVLDHIILTKQTYYSFADEGELQVTSSGPSGLTDGALNALLPNQD
ncbi:MAG: JAB domain-containing protein [Bacteroidota bacterium]